MHALLDRYTEALKGVGAAACFQPWASFEPASDAQLAELTDYLGVPLPADLEAWLRHVSRELPFVYNYSACAPGRLLERQRRTAEIDFSRHLTNVRSWRDGRWDDGRITPVYWSPRWLPIAEDGCGNQVCVDLQPGPRGQLGQLLSMEFQDGQGPTLNPHRSLEAFVEAHLRWLAEGRFTVDDEGFIEFDG